jgi:2-keto-4-pentenoate hydratase
MGDDTGTEDTGTRDTGAAAWLAEAFETGNALAPLPPALAPADARAGERIALAVLESLGLAACGVRLAPGPGDTGGQPVAGPMLEGRLLSARTPVLVGALRHARASAAVIAVLAEDLPEGGTGLPALAALHPAIDIAASRFRDGPGTAALLAADLGGLGQVVVGRRLPSWDIAALHAVPVTLVPTGRRPRATETDLVAALVSAADAARRLGGLPAGAVLVAAGLSATVTPEPGTRLSAGFGPLGRVIARFA